MLKTIVILFACLTSTVLASPIDGRLSVETPISADRLSDQSTMILGSLSAHLTKRLTLTGSAQYNMGNLDAFRRECWSEDKVKGTLAYDLSRDIAVYSYYERRFSLGQDRIVAGCTYRFKVGK